MLLGAIEIGLCSTRLTVSDVGAESSRILIDREHALPVESRRVERLNCLLAADADAAKAAGVERIEVTALAELRGSRLIKLAERFVKRAALGSIRIQSRSERAAASFVAVGRRERDFEGSMTVATIDEDAIGIASGIGGGRPSWVGSRPAGTVTMTRRARFSDPPLPAQLEAAVHGATRAVASLHPPASERFLISSRLAPVVARLCGERPGPRDTRRGLDAILGQTVDDISAWFGVGRSEATRLPGTLVGFTALSAALGREVEPVSLDPVAARHWLSERPTGTGAGR